MDSFQYLVCYTGAWRLHVLRSEDKAKITSTLILKNKLLEHDDSSQSSLHRGCLDQPCACNVPGLPTPFLGHCNYTGIRDHAVPSFRGPSPPEERPGTHCSRMHNI